MKTIVKKLDHTRLRVSDLDKTVHFFKTVLGLEELRRSESPRGSRLVFLSVPGSEEKIELTYFPNSGAVEVQEDLMHLAFEVESMKAFGQHIASLGVEFSDGPHTSQSSGTTFAFIDAPDGYEIELIESKG